LFATSDHAATDVRRSRRLIASPPALWCWCPASVLCLGPPASLLLEPAGYEGAQQERHRDDHHEPSDKLAERELPADQQPDHRTEFDDQVRRRELEGECRGGRRALLEERLRDCDRRVRT